MRAIYVYKRKKMCQEIKTKYKKRPGWSYFFYLLSFHHHHKRDTTKNRPATNNCTGIDRPEETSSR